MIVKDLYPLISCICVTGYRPHFLLKAIIYWDAQNYPNRELVISCPESDISTQNLVKKISSRADLNILLIERKEELTLGTARNEAIARCNGEYICIWDDDDYHREVRLMYQFTILRAKRQKCEASIITSVVLYDRINNHLYLSDNRNWEGTLLCKKDLVLQHPYIDRNIAEGEDLIKYLTGTNYLHYFANYNLYTFIYHGNNVLSAEHFSDFFSGRDFIDQGGRDWLLSQINRAVDLKLS